VVERVPKTAPKGVVFCRLFTGTETYAVIPLSHLLPDPALFLSDNSPIEVTRIPLAHWINRKTKRSGAAIVRLAMVAGLARLRYFRLPIG
jgi:hypothetical protein